MKVLKQLVGVYSIYAVYSDCANDHKDYQGKVYMMKLGKQVYT